MQKELFPKEYMSISFKMKHPKLSNFDEGFYKKSISHFGEL